MIAILPIVNPFHDIARDKKGDTNNTDHKKLVQLQLRKSAQTSGPRNSWQRYRYESRNAHQQNERQRWPARLEKESFSSN